MNAPYPPALSRLTWGLVWLALAVVYCVAVEVCQAQEGTASYYTISSAIREGTCTDAAHRTCLMANGRPLNDKAFTAASWNHPFGSRLRVSQLIAGHPRSHPKSVLVTVTDRGPARRLYRQGRLLDLSQAAFEALAPRSAGVIAVSVERVR